MALSKVNTNIAFQISFSIYERLKKVHLSYFHKIDTVYLVNRINSDSNDIIGFFTTNSITIFTQSLAMILGLCLLFYINTIIALVTVIAIPVYIILYTAFRKKLYSANYAFFEQRSQYFSRMTEQLSFIKFIKTHALYEVFSNRLNRTYNKLFLCLIKYCKINYIFTNASCLILAIINAFVFFYGGLGVVAGNISIGQFTIINVYFNLIVSALNYFLGLGSSYQQFLVANNRLLEFTKIETEKNGIALIENVESIKVKNLSFSYEQQGQKLLNNFNIEFYCGKIYALLGENGSGKSTFISIILGLYNDLYKGDIEYNGIDIKSLDMYRMRSKYVGVTEQEPVLLNTNLLDNIFIGIEKNMEIYQNYYKTFHINELLYRSKDNMESESQSLNLSGGEKQKISIIRNLLKNACVMIYDEPTSALDKTSTEEFKQIMKNIKKDKIIILITHDDKLLDIVDETVYFY